MASVNKCIFIGNLTRDPELRHTPQGTAVAELGLAVNRTFKDSAGRKQEEVTWITCTAWGAQAETLTKYLGKGDPLYLETRAKNDEWTDKETGKKRTATRFVVTEFQFLPRAGGTGSAGATAPPSHHQDSGHARSSTSRGPIPEPTEPTAAAAPEKEEDDIPF